MSNEIGFTPESTTAPAPSQGGDPTGAWDTPQGTTILRPDGTGRDGGEEIRWEVAGTLLKIIKGAQWVGVPFTAEGDILVLGSGPVATCQRAGVPGVWVGNESSLDPGIYMSFTQMVTLFPDGTVAYSKSESGASRNQVSACIEQFRHFSNRGAAVQAAGRWQSDGQRIAIQFAFRGEPAEGWVDLANLKMKLGGMGKLPGNEGGPVTFERQ